MKCIGPYKPSDDDRLKFYGFFKQARVGPCSTEKPGLLSVFERAKWNAWEKLGKMSKEEAMTKYLEVFMKVKAAAEAASKK
jgi:acyl-CoA-binding protein